VLPRDSAPFGTVGTEKRAASRHHLPQAERYLVAFLCATWYREIWREKRTTASEATRFGLGSFSSAGGFETSGDESASTRGSE
jgi:hypothetical protein